MKVRVKVKEVKTIAKIAGDLVEVTNYIVFNGRTKSNDIKEEARRELMAEAGDAPVEILVSNITDTLMAVADVTINSLEVEDND